MALNIDMRIKESFLNRHELNFNHEHFKEFFFEATTKTLFSFQVICFAQHYSTYPCRHRLILKCWCAIVAFHVNQWKPQTARISDARGDSVMDGEYILISMPWNGFQMDLIYARVKFEKFIITPFVSNLVRLRSDTFTKCVDSSTRTTVISCCATSENIAFVHKSNILHQNSAITIIIMVSPEPNCNVLKEKRSNSQLIAL